MGRLRRPRTSIRLRLTLWYTLSLAIAMAVLVGTMYLALESTLETSLHVDLERGTLTLAERLEDEFAEGEAPAQASEEIVRRTPLRAPRSPAHNFYVEVYGPDGGLLAATSELGGRRLAENLDLGAAPLFDDGMLKARLEGTEYDPAGVETAAVRIANRTDGADYTLVVGTGLSPIAEALATLRHLMFALTPLLLLLSAVGGLGLARRALAPVVSLADQARQMGADRLSRRLEVPNPDDELGHLAATFNELLDRIELAFERMRRFVADASHELRTPVSIMKSGIDVALTEPVSADESLEALVTMREEVSRLKRLVDDMFVLARADAGDGSMVTRERVAVVETVVASVRAVESLGIRHNVAVRHGRRPKVEALCLGDRGRLEQVLLNLLTNATQYTEAGGEVVVDVDLVERDGHATARVSVTDNGPGIPEQHRDAVFERFFRMDRARKRGKGGSGLGLPIARWIAEAHGGSITLAEARGGGCIFTLTLPVTIAAPDAETPASPDTRIERIAVD